MKTYTSDYYDFDDEQTYADLIEQDVITVDELMQSDLFNILQDPSYINNHKHLGYLRDEKMRDIAVQGYLSLLDYPESFIDIYWGKANQIAYDILALFVLELAFLEDILKETDMNFFEAYVESQDYNAYATALLFYSRLAMYLTRRLEKQYLGKHYDELFYYGYDANPIFDFFKEMDITNLIAQIETFEKNVLAHAQPMDSTLLALGFTPEGDYSYDWDVHGWLRHADFFNDDLECFFSNTIPIKTKVMDNKVFFLQYCENAAIILKYFLEHYEKIVKKNTGFYSFLSAVDSGYAPHLSPARYRQFRSSSTAILRLALQKAKEPYQGISSLKCSDITSYENNLIAMIKKAYIPQVKEDLKALGMSPSYTGVLDTARGFIESGLNTQKFFVEQLEGQSLKNKAQIFDLIQKEKEYFDGAKLIRALLKTSLPMEQLRTLYLIFPEAVENTPPLKKKLISSLPKKNIEDLQKLVKEEKPITIETFEELRVLAEPKRKEVILDRSKIASSRKELSNTIQAVNEYLQEEAEELPVQKKPKKKAKPKPEAVKKETDADLEILKEIVKNGKMAESLFEEKAMAKSLLPDAYLSKLNERFFEIVNDAVLVHQEDSIEVDPFYLDDVNAWLEDKA